MSDKSYTGVIKKVFKNLELSAIVYLAHIRICIAPGCLDIEEIDGMDKRAIGNWTTDAFGSHYDTKLSLPALPVMSG